jgi:6,7-dimethyl-8-ribityllumazine synthase
MKTIEAGPLKKQFNVAIITSRFNEAVTEKLTASAIKHLQALEFSDDQITAVSVSGAVEIPLIAQQLAETHSYEAIICLGCVIRGETSHYDYVCEQVSQGCQRVSLDHNIPVIFGILTTENGEQALARAGGNHSDKGIESVNTAIEMVSLMRQFM